MKDVAKRKQLEKIKNLPKVNSTFPVSNGRPKKNSIPKRKSSDDGSLASENGVFSLFFFVYRFLGKKVKLEAKMTKMDEHVEENALKRLKETFDDFSNISEKDETLTPMKMFCNFLDRLDVKNSIGEQQVIFNLGRRAKIPSATSEYYSSSLGNALRSS